MDSYSSEGARRDMRQVLSAVERGEYVQIRKYKTPTGIVVPDSWFRRAISCLGEPEPEFVPVDDKTGETK